MQQATLRDDLCKMELILLQNKMLLVIYDMVKNACGLKQNRGRKKLNTWMNFLKLNKKVQLKNKMYTGQ